MRVLKILSILVLASIAAFAQHTNNGATLTIQSGLQVYSNNSFVNSGGGTINMNGSTLNLTGNCTNNATINASSGTVNLTGNWTNNATFNASSSTVNLTGVAQSLGGSSVTTFFNLNLSGSGVKSLSSNQNISGTLALNNLQLNTAGNTISVTNTSTSAVTRTSGFVSSTSGGALAWNTAGSSLYNFPVGSGSLYRNVEITPSSGGSTYSVRLANLDATSEGFNRASVLGGINSLNPAYFHVVNRTAGSSPANITFNLYGDVYSGVAHWNGSQWHEIPSLNEVTVFNRITATGVSAFSPFIVFAAGDTLSVPTLSEWGLIILSLLTLTLVAVFLGRRELAIFGGGGSAGSSGFYNMITNVPFEKAAYLKILKACMLAAVTGFAIIHALIGTNGVIDLAGTLICTFIIAYLIYLHKEFDRFKS